MAMWSVAVWRLRFLKTHSIHSIFSTSYQSTETANEEEMTPIQSEEKRSDVISQAVSATLNNVDVTIGPNRRKRNYTSNSKKTNNQRAGKPEISKLVEMS